MITKRSDLTNLLLPAIIGFTFFSCKNDSNHNIPDQGISINVNLDEAIDLEEGTDGIEGIVLEQPDKFPGDILSAIIYDKGMIMLDAYASHGIFGYDLEGRQTFVYDKIGQGPDEMLEPSDIQLFRDSIYVLDNMSSSIIVLNPDGTYNRRFRIPTYAMSFAVDSVGTLWLDHLNNQAAADGNNLTFIGNDRTGNVVKIQEDLNNVTIGSAHSLINVGDKVHYLKPMEPIIMECGYEPAILYHFEFGDRWPSRQVCASGRNPYDIMMDITNNGLVHDLRLTETKGTLCLSFIASDITYYLITDKKSNNTKLYKDKDNIYGHPLGFDNLGRLVMITRSEESHSVHFCHLKL